jgi:hypothetical protein
VVGGAGFGLLNLLAAVFVLVVMGAAVVARARALTRPEAS